MVAEPAETLPVAKKKRGRPAIMRSFYGSALDVAAEIALNYAGDIDGLDKEIALLRAKLRESLETRRTDRGEGEHTQEDYEKRFQLMVRGIDTLAKLVSVRYRLSKRAEEDIGSHIAALLRGFSDQFYLESADGP